MKSNFTPLSEPIPIKDHTWPEDTLPLVHTRTMTFMHEEYIEECIEGIINQKTTFPVQVLIHDDASTDRTAEIIRQYELTYPNLIKAYYQPKNTYSQKNKNELRAEFMAWRIGRYEAMCEGDDYWIYPLKLQKQVDYLESHPECSLCFHDAVTINQLTGKEINKFNIPKKEKIAAKDIILKAWFIPTASIVFRMKHLPEYGSYPDWYIKSKAGDIALQIYLAKFGYFHALSGKLSVYRYYANSSLTLSNKGNDPIPGLIQYGRLISRANAKHFNYKYIFCVAVRWARILASIVKHKLKPK